MVKLVQWTPDELDALSSHVGKTRPTIPGTVFDPIAEGVAAPGFGDTAAAAFQRENLTLEALREAAINVRQSSSPANRAVLGEDFGGDSAEPEFAERNPAWNPYRHIRENWHEDQQADLDLEIRQGFFEGVRDAEQLERKAANLRREKRLLDTIQRGPALGHVLGALAGAATDLTSYVPLAGPIARVRSLGRVGKGVLLGTAAAALPEIGLHQFQDLRTAEESFLNIGVGAVLGGGIGAFSRVAFPGHPLHNANLDNPLRPENLQKQGVGIRTPDGDVEIVEFRDAGGAATPTDAPRPLPGLASGIPGVSKLTETITGATPVGRALRYTGDRSRGLLVRMMNLGGVLTDTNRFGVKTAASAEDIKRDFLTHRDRLFAFAEKQIVSLNRDLGSLPGGFRGTVSDARYNDVARLKLLQEWTANDSRALASEFGADAAQKIEASADTFAERIHKTNAEFERELIDIGKLSPEAAMGRDYGHAQLWDPFTVMARQEDFEDFLLDVLVDSPDGDWLTGTFQLAPEDFARLGSEEVTFNGRVYSPEDGATFRKEILRDWAGDEKAFRETRADLQAASAEKALREAELDLTDTMKAYRMVAGETHRLEVSEARKFRDQFNARLETARVRKTELETERRSLIEAATAARSRGLERQSQLLEALQPEVRPGGTAKRVPDPARTPSLAEIETRAKAVAAELKRATVNVGRMETKLARVESAYQNAASRLEDAKVARAALKEGVGDAKAIRTEAVKAARKAARAVKSAEARTPLANTVSDIHRALIDRQALPHSILDRIVPETGRVKARRIRLTPEQRRKAEQLGFLRTDLGAILHSQYDQLSGFIGLHRGLDMIPGGRFQSWDEVLRTVDDEYRDIVARNPPEAARLNAERESVRKDMNLLKDRLLGTENVGADRDGWAYWLSSKARQANFIRFGAGFLLPSLTDIASVHLRTGSLAKLLRNHGAQAARIMRGMDKTELQAVLNSVELSMGGVRMAKALDADDALVHFGIGPRGTFKHTFTSNVDRGARFLSDKTNVLSGMKAWNRYWKIAAGIQRAYRLRDMVARYDALSGREVADLASLGIDREAAARIQAMIAKHGQTDAKGHFDPHLEDWPGSPSGREAARDFRIAIERDMDRAVFTPGIGDTPGIMSSAVGKLWLQFQTYAFSFLNRFMTPASQRLASFRDAQALASYGHLAWSALLVVVGKDILRGEDPARRFEDGAWGNTAKDMLDRTGMLTYLSPYVDSALKVSVPLQEAAFGDVVAGPSSRFVRNQWLESLFGANYALARDIQSFGSAVSEGDADAMTRKGLLLAPLNFYFRLGHSLAVAG